MNPIATPTHTIPLSLDLDLPIGIITIVALIPEEDVSDESKEEGKQDDGFVEEQVPRYTVQDEFT